MVPVTLEIQILWTKVGLLSNPQAQILGARYFYQCHPLKVWNLKPLPHTQRQLNGIHRLFKKQEIKWS